MAIILAVLTVLTIATIAWAIISQRTASRIHDQLDELATHDSLTGLLNRVALNAQLAPLLERTSTQRFAVLLVSLDRFDAVNDHYGHDIGDQLMVAVAGQLNGAVDSDESLYRLGGPDFMLIAPAINSPHDANARATLIQQAINVPYRIEHDRLRISAGVGIVMVDARHTSVATVLEDASAAVTEGRGRGQGSVVTFEVAMADSKRPFDVQERMQQALDNDEFMLMYQPVVSLSDSKIVGVESVLYWAHPERGLVSSNEVYSLLDKTDLVGMIGDWVILQACRHNQRWQKAFPQTEIVTTVTVLPAQLDDTEFVDRVLRIIDLTGTDPTRICLEIIEGESHETVHWTWALLRQAKEVGVQLALGEFGTGFSTFDYIRKLNLDVLKLSKVFVERIDKNEGDFSIVQQLIGMAHALDMVAIAEGVETKAQAEGLKGANCDLAQGDYWSPPVPLETVEKMIGRGNIRPGATDRKTVNWKPEASPA